MPTMCTRPGILVKFGIFMILMMTPRCTRLGRCQRGISTSALLVPEHLDRFFVDIERFKIMKNIIFNINTIIIIIIDPARYVQQQTQSVEARMGETWGWPSKRSPDRSRCLFSFVCGLCAWVCLCLWPWNNSQAMFCANCVSIDQGRKTLQLWQYIGAMSWQWVYNFLCTICCVQFPVYNFLCAISCVQFLVYNFLCTISCL